jgi:uncharacterized OsmC-like protein
VCRGDAEVGRHVAGDAGVGDVRAKGDLDFRGTLGVDKAGEAPVRFRANRLIFDLDSNASEEQLEKLLSLTERYCVVYQTLTSGVAVSLDHSP